MTPNGNEGVGVQIDYLENAYGTRYYIINKVNGQINAIHDDSLELTEFKGHFSSFDLDNLEFKVCRLAVGDEYEETCLSIRTLFKDAILTQTHKIQKNQQVRVLMKIILVQYCQLIKQPHSKELQCQH